MIWISKVVQLYAMFLHCNGFLISQYLLTYLKQTSAMKADRKSGGNESSESNLFFSLSLSQVSAGLHWLQVWICGLRLEDRRETTNYHCLCDCRAHFPHSSHCIHLHLLTVSLCVYGCVSVVDVENALKGSHLICWELHLFMLLTRVG